MRLTSAKFPSVEDVGTSTELASALVLRFLHSHLPECVVAAAGAAAILREEGNAPASRARLGLAACARVLICLSAKLFKLIVFTASTIAPSLLMPLSENAR